MRRGAALTGRRTGRVRHCTAESSRYEEKRKGEREGEQREKDAIL